MRVPIVTALVLVAACADPLVPPQSGLPHERPDLPPATMVLPATSEPDALDLLLSTTMFETPSRGLSFDDPRNWVAWRRILLGETAAADFRFLYENATTPEGRMYGVAGILAADPGASTILAADPRWGEVEIRYVSGCVGSNPPAPLLIRSLATPQMRRWFRTGQLSVDAP